MDTHLDEVVRLIGGRSGRESQRMYGAGFREFYMRRARQEITRKYGNIAWERSADAARGIVYALFPTDRER